MGAQRELLDELRNHAQRIDAAGIIDVQFAHLAPSFKGPSGVVGTLVELAATGTPITAHVTPRPKTPFCTAIDAAGIAALLRGGWIPVDLLVAGTVQTRSRQHRAGDAEAATGTSNREIPGPTDMIQRARRLLNDHLRSSAQSIGADGVLLHGGFDVTWSSTYHLVEVSATGSAIARYGNGYVPLNVILPLAGGSQLRHESPPVVARKHLREGARD